MVLRFGVNIYFFLTFWAFSLFGILSKPEFFLQSRQKTSNIKSRSRAAFYFCRLLNALSRCANLNEWLWNPKPPSLKLIIDSAISNSDARACCIFFWNLRALAQFSPHVLARSLLFTSRVCLLYKSSSILLFLPSFFSNLFWLRFFSLSVSLF